MTSWCLRIGATLLVLAAPLFGQEQQTPRAQSPSSSPWQPPRLSDGQPDVQGVWGAVLVGVFSLTNPMTGGDDFAQRLGGPPIRRPSRIIQAPASVVFVWEDYHAYRVVPLDGRPHVGSAMKLWMGDARGHWEGNTLVIDTTNMNGKGRLSVVGDFFSEHAHVTERLTFVDADTMNYEATIDDPDVFTRPWTLRAAEKRKPDYEFWENACHEGEMSVESMLLTDRNRNKP